MNLNRLRKTVRSILCLSTLQETTLTVSVNRKLLKSTNSCRLRSSAMSFILRLKSLVCFVPGRLVSMRLGLYSLLVLWAVHRRLKQSSWCIRWKRRKEVYMLELSGVGILQTMRWMYVLLSERCYLRMAWCTCKLVGVSCMIAWKRMSMWKHWTS